LFQFSLLTVKGIVGVAHRGQVLNSSDRLGFLQTEA
jgi:hypothetical protein